MCVFRKRKNPTVDNGFCVQPRKQLVNKLWCVWGRRSCHFEWSKRNERTRVSNAKPEPVIILPGSWGFCTVMTYLLHLKCLTPHLFIFRMGNIQTVPVFWFFLCEFLIFSFFFLFLIFSADMWMLITCCQNKFI